MSTTTTQEIYAGIGMPIPKSYQKALQENSVLVEQLFGVSSTIILATPISAENSGDPKVFQSLLHFLDVYIEIFDHSAKQQKLSVIPVIKGDSSVLQQCITKSREIWRQDFRGFQYLSEKKLEQALKRSELETLLKLPTFQDKSFVETLKAVMLIEQGWIKRINEHKRNKDLEEIQTEAVDKFKTEVASAFPFLFDEDQNKEGKQFKYYEDVLFEWKLGEIIKECKTSFRADIPFKEVEKEDVLRLVLNNLTVKLEENVVKDLKSRNDSKKIVIRDYMDSLVEKCVENYKSSITTAILGENADGKCTQVQIEAETILQLHKKLLEEQTPKFIITENGIEIGTEEYQVKCFNTFNSKTYDIFRELVEKLNDNCQNSMIACHQETKEEIQACLEKVTDILGRYGGMISYSNVLKSQFESGIGSVFGQVKEVNRSSKDHLLSATKPVHILTNEETQYQRMMNMCKTTYSEKMVYTLQVSLKYPHSVDIILLEQCHQEAKSTAMSLVRSTNSKEIAPYLIPKLESKFTAYVIHFITQAKANLKDFNERISSVIGSSIQFNPVKGTDTEIENGREMKINTLHQCITAMAEYEDKSSEELRLEYKLSKSLASEKILELLEQSVSYFEMYENFGKSLNIANAGFCFTNKPIQILPLGLSSRGHLSVSQGHTLAFPGFRGTFSSTNASHESRRVKKPARRFNK